jgi:hypothetical protein
MNVKYEFFEFVQDANLVIDKPCGLTFINTSLVPGATIIINNTFILSSVRDTILGTANYPNTLLLTNNNNEIDVTHYRIKNPASEGKLSVIAKFFE